jgi:multiple sugar transport system substrate-binding protein
VQKKINQAFQKPISRRKSKMKSQSGLPKQVSYTILLIVLLMFGLVLSACGGSATEETSSDTADTTETDTTDTADTTSEDATEPEADDGPITLKMAAWDIATTPYWQAVIDAYEAQNPNVTVELVEVSSQEYQDKVNIMLSGGDDTDIITVKDIPGYSAMLTRGQIDPLESYIEADGLDLSVYSGAAEELTFEGSIYALPFRSDIWILYYNKDLFDAAGVDYPTNDMTWEQFDAIARQMTSGSGADKVYGTHFHTWRSTVELGTVQDGLNTVIATDYSFMKPMYDMVVAMQDDGIIMDYGSLKAGSVHYSGVFKNEQIAMLPMGSWFIGSLIAAKAEGEIDFDWGVVKFPHPEGVEAGTTAGTLTSLAINTNSQNKDAAWDFIKFYSGVEGAKVLAGTGNLPAIRTAEVLDVFSALDGVPAEATDALQTAAVRLELPMHPSVGAVEQILNEEHELIMTNSVSVDEGLTEMTSRVSEALGQ